MEVVKTTPLCFVTERAFVSEIEMDRYRRHGTSEGYKSNTHMEQKLVRLLYSCLLSFCNYHVNELADRVLDR